MAVAREKPVSLHIQTQNGDSGNCSYGVAAVGLSCLPMWLTSSSLSAAMWAVAAWAASCLPPSPESSKFWPDWRCSFSLWFTCTVRQAFLVEQSWQHSQNTHLTVVGSSHVWSELARAWLQSSSRFCCEVATGAAGCFLCFLWVEGLL
jgi:hypothetical protein